MQAAGKRAGASALLGALLAMVGCADPFIESTTILEDTPDLAGPYVVESIAIGTREGDRLELHHSRLDQIDGVVIMRDIDDDGDGRSDLYRGAIPGPLAAGEISYFVVLVSSGEITSRDPPGDGPSAPRFVFSVGP